MRKSSRSFLAAAVGSVLLLTACGSGEAGDGSETDQPATGGVMPTVEGDFGEEPTITYPSGSPSDELEVQVLVEGDGPEVEQADVLIADYIGQIWDSETFDNSFERPEPASFPIGIKMVIAGWDQGLVGQKIGSRVLLSIPSELGYAEGNAGAGIEPGDTIVFVVDIIDSYGIAQAGDADATVNDEAFANLPIDIEGEVGEPVEISIKDGAAPPTEPATTVLAEGKGAPIEPGTTAMHFAIAVWGDEEGGSTWADKQVASMTLGDGSTPFDGLLGQPIGSRALIEIPAMEGAEAMAVIVDVLGQPRR